MNDQSYVLDINKIQEYLPHRAPFLMIDRVLEIVPQGDLDDLSSAGKEGTKVTAIKSVSINEPFFKGHFPGFPIMPGVLILESMAQTAGFSLYPQACRHLKQFQKGFKLILVGVESARFRRPVLPGDVLRIETVVQKTRGKLWIFDCSVTVEGNKTAEAVIMANLMPTDDM